MEHKKDFESLKKSLMVCLIIIFSAIFLVSVFRIYHAEKTEKSPKSTSSFNNKFQSFYSALKSEVSKRRQQGYSKIYIDDLCLRRTEKWKETLTPDEINEFNRLYSQALQELPIR